MSNSLSYSLQDFIPFTAEIYFRLLERMNEAFWPLHLVTLVLGLVTVWLALKYRTRLTCLLIVPVWAFIAVAFFSRLYAELSWVGGYIAFSFLAQAMLLLLITLTGIGLDSKPRSSLSAAIGILIALTGLIGLPITGFLTGGSWAQVEVFGIHPDPTAMTTLGLVVIMLRGWGMWLTSLIPTVWLLFSGLTLWGLGAVAASLLILVALVTALIGLVCPVVYRIRIQGRKQ